MLDGGHLNRRKVFGLELSALEVGPGESPFLVLDHIVEQVELCGPQELRVSRAQLLASLGCVARPRNELRRGSRIEQREIRERITRKVVNDSELLREFREKWVNLEGNWLVLLFGHCERFNRWSISVCRVLDIVYGFIVEIFW